MAFIYVISINLVDIDFSKITKFHILMAKGINDDTFTFTVFE